MIEESVDLGELIDSQSYRQYNDNIIMTPHQNGMIDIETQLQEEEEQQEEILKYNVGRVSKMNKEQIASDTLCQSQDSIKRMHQECQQQSFIYQRSIQKNFIASPKIFLLAGGIVVELANYHNENDYEMFIKSTAVSKPEKFNDGSISISLELQEALHDFEYVINVLQQTQNQDDYDLSVQIRQLQRPVLDLRQQIDIVLDLYDANELLRIIEHRNLHLLQIQQECIQHKFNDDDFANIITYSIDWKLKSMANSNFFISQSMLALFGTSADEFIHHIMRKNLNWILTPSTRKQIITSSIQFFTSENQDNSFKIQEFEIRMIDNIIIKCTCKFQIVNIQYPPELNFYGQNLDSINFVDCISILKFDITPEHIEQILRIRQNMNLNLNNKQFLYCQDFDEYVIDNFEYYMQCQVFINKFYKKEANSSISFAQDNVFKQSRCKYRKINIQNY